MPDAIPGDVTLAAAHALELVAPELLALDALTLHPVNVDVADAALIVLGAAPDIASHRAALVALCGEEQARSVDRLELLARAALQAHARYRVVETGADIVPLAEQLSSVRATLVAEVRALIARRVLPAGTIGSLVGGKGYKDLCVDVLQLVSVLTDQWETVGPKTGLGREELDRADALANQLATAVGLREQGVRSPAADLRQRALTLFAETYDDVRRMIWYLRWKHGDADRIAPSIFRGRRRRSTPASDVATPEASAPAQSAPPGMPGAAPFDPTPGPSGEG